MNTFEPEDLRSGRRLLHLQYAFCSSNCILSLTLLGLYFLEFLLYPVRLVHCLRKLGPESLDLNTDIINS
jgi:hypothetical protein